MQITEAEYNRAVEILESTASAPERLNNMVIVWGKAFDLKIDKKNSADCIKEVIGDIFYDALVPYNEIIEAYERQEDIAEQKDQEDEYKSSRGV